MKRRVWTIVGGMIGLAFCPVMLCLVVTAPWLVIGLLAVVIMILCCVIGVVIGQYFDD